MTDDREVARSDRSTLRDEVAAMARSWLATGEASGAGPLWTAVPTALFGVTDRSASAGSTGWGRRAGSLTSMLTLASRGRGASIVAVGAVVFVFEDGNPRTTLAPVIAALGERLGATPKSIRVRPSPAVLAAELRESERAARVMAEQLPGGLPASLDAALQAAARSRARAAAALKQARPRLLVVASQHSTSSRAFIRLAREQGIATAYLPHAPVADTYQYRDLPIDFAGLRGVREVEFYRGLGVTGELTVVGNPQAKVRVPERLDAHGPIVFAPSPRGRDEIEAQIDALAFAEHVVVSPHPRMRGRRAHQPRWPSDWSVHGGRTVELFAQGVPCVVQASSGVAWEAMAHGVPVIQVTRGASEAPPYPVIQAPYARLSAPADLQRAVTLALSDAVDEGVRAAMMGWAGEWCECTGDDAVGRATDWLARCLAMPRPGPLLDYWSSAPEARHDG